MTKPRYFESGSDFRRWLEKHHTTVPELLVGFRKAHVKNRGLTYAEALDAALCYGWIDGVRRSLGEETWTIRFTPRRRGSNWSLVNIRRMHELLADDVVSDAGRIVFGARDEAKSASYSYEQRTKGFDAAHEEELKRHKAEWEFYQSLPPSYRTAASWFVMSAKREETRKKRMTRLIESCARRERLEHLTPTAKRAGAKNATAKPAAPKPAAPKVDTAKRPLKRRVTAKSAKR